MKLSDYIRTEIDCGRRDFDIGIALNKRGEIIVDSKSLSRVRFKVRKQKMSLFNEFADFIRNLIQWVLQSMRNLIDILLNAVK